jgi:hypothetical protein
VKRSEIEAIKRRCNAATVGPWGIVELDDKWIVGLMRGGLKERVWVEDSSCIERREDADFIAHARADVPELVAEVERLRAILGAVKSEVENEFYAVALMRIRAVLGEE